jgi:hypothetical protein
VGRAALARPRGSWFPTPSATLRAGSSDRDKNVARVGHPAVGRPGMAKPGARGVIICKEEEMVVSKSD